MFQTLQPQPDDPLLALIGLFRDDPRPGKLDLGVGTYRDEHGETPVMAVVKSAERALHETQRTKAYLGPEGDQRFVDLLRPIVFGAAEDYAGRLVGVQTPGGCGALRLGAELIAAARPGTKIWLGTPTWPNHHPILDAAGLSVAEYRYFDVVTQTLHFDDVVMTLGRAEPGDVILLHGCCHNPTGAELDERQWDRIADLVAERRLIPFVDLAYQGLGRGLEPDSYGTRRVIGSAEEALVAYSCDKNFGLYRDRTGALFVLARDPAQATIVRSNLLTHARVNWSMPPDHGAAAVRIVLEDESRTLMWRNELAAMCERINGVRRALAAHPDLAFLAEQRGMFSMLPIGREAIAALRRDHGIYMAGSGRINVAGLRTTDAETFIRALDAVGALTTTLAVAQS